MERRIVAVLVVFLTACLARGDVIYNTLNFADELLYDTANGNAWSGKGRGDLRDVQICDDFSTTDKSLITRVTADYLCFDAGTPAGGLQVDIYRDEGGFPSEDALYSTTVPVAEATDLDGVFLGRRFSADVWIPLADHTHYYIMIQAIDLTDEGDWYYQVIDLDSRIGTDRYNRDGGRADGGYGSFTWVRGAYGGGEGTGDVGMAIYAIPGAGSSMLLTLAGLAAGRRRT